VLLKEAAKSYGGKAFLALPPRFASCLWVGKNRKNLSQRHHFHLDVGRNFRGQTDGHHVFAKLLDRLIKQDLLFANLKAFFFEG